MKKTLFLAIILHCTNPQVATSAISGNEIYAVCNSSVETEKGFCIGYVTGAWEGIKTGTARMLLQSGAVDIKNIDSSSNEFLQICMPSSATVLQSLDVFISYLRDNPKNRHDTARNLIINAYQEAFPC
ncbi:MAG: Rap1a/Tai family immunity protein [Nitratireductor sp.]